MLPRKLGTQVGPVGLVYIHGNEVDLGFEKAVVRRKAASELRYDQVAVRAQIGGEERSDNGGYFLAFGHDMATSV